MYNRGKIIIGILIFLAFVTYPFYSNIGKAVAKPELKIDTPFIQQMTKKECVKPKEFMRAEHMQLLNDWRNAVVRDGNRAPLIIDGKEYDKSLQNGCMKCHSNKKDFCDSCHSYASVKPHCWDCHIEPKESKS